MKNGWEHCKRDLFFSRNDPSDPRLGDFVRPHESVSHGSGLIVAGYSDDEGIKINGGRVGAASAPDVIRKHFYKMTPSPLKAENPVISDFGNLSVGSFDLGSRHETVRASVRDHLKAGFRWAGLGGGHDYGYADGAGFLDVFGDKRPLIINFDAHLDVRPPKNGFSSGTPFFRLYESFKSFDFVELGIQLQCNSRDHLKWLTDRGGKIIYWDEIAASGRRLVDVVVSSLGEGLLRARPTYLSVDIDSFSSAYAPGCSQSFATGFEPREFFELFDFLCARLDVRILGLYEVSPPLDIDDRTSKLAALILHRFLRCQV